MTSRTNLIPSVLLALHVGCCAESLPLLRQGDTWRYQQLEVVGARESKGPAVDVRVSYRAKGGIWALATFQGTASYAQLKRQGQIPVVTPGHSISTASCIVDVVTGNSIDQGRGCERPLTQGESWTINESNNASSINVTIESSAVESLEVPAGTFEANRLKVVVVESPLPHGTEASQPQEYWETIYWYSREVRGMLKIERRFFDSRRTHTHSVVQVLTEFNNL